VNATVWCSDKFRSDWNRFIEFVQHQVNRLAFGYAQYEIKTGGPCREARYMKRLGLELRAYRRTGNREHLVNIANYAWLESQAPENKRFHWDATVGSATRGKAGL
jgi:hypothetical protein